MKKAIAFSLMLIFIFSAISCSFASSVEDTDIFSSIGEFFSGAWEEASSWTEGKWRDTSEWINRAWNDSSAWVSDIWGDVSSWSEDTFNGATNALDTWFNETFDCVTDNADDIRKWLKEEAPSLKAKWEDQLNIVRKVISDFSDSALEKTQLAFTELVSDLDFSKEDIDKIWTTVEAYSDQKGISVLKVSKIVLPYLLELIKNRDGDDHANISALSVAKYIIGILESKGISNEENAEKLIPELIKILTEH